MDALLAALNARYYEQKNSLLDHKDRFRPVTYDRIRNETEERLDEAFADNADELLVSLVRQGSPRVCGALGVSEKTPDEQVRQQIGALGDVEAKAELLYNHWQNGDWINAVTVPLSELDRQRVLSKLSSVTLYRGDVDEQTLKTNGQGCLYLTYDVSTAEHYAGEEGSIYTAHITPKNPLFVDNTDCTFDMEGSSALREVIEAGYDCIVPLDEGDVVVLDDDIVTPGPVCARSDQWYYASERHVSVLDTPELLSGPIEDAPAFHSNALVAARPLKENEPLYHSPELIESTIAQFKSRGKGLDAWVRMVQQFDPYFDPENPDSYQKGITMGFGSIESCQVSGEGYYHYVGEEPLTDNLKKQVAEKARAEGADYVSFYGVLSSPYAQEYSVMIVLNPAALQPAVALPTSSPVLSFEESTAPVITQLSQILDGVENYADIRVISECMGALAAHDIAVSKEEVSQALNAEQPVEEVLSLARFAVCVKHTAEQADLTPTPNPGASLSRR
jgi:hypothetical protein